MKRTPLARGTTPLKRGEPLRRMSKRRREELKRLTLAKAVVERRSGGYCEAVALQHVCSGVATEFHHIIRRSQGGPHTPANLLHACGEAHRTIHAHPALSFEIGYLKRNVGAV